MTPTEERRKPGRPRRFAQGRMKAAVRVTPQMYATLKTAARSNGRSISEEIEIRLERRTWDEEVGKEIAISLKRVADALEYGPLSVGMMKD